MTFTHWWTLTTETSDDHWSQMWPSTLLGPKQQALSLTITDPKLTCLAIILVMQSKTRSEDTISWMFKECNNLVNDQGSIKVPTISRNMSTRLSWNQMVTLSKLPNDKDISI